MAIQNILLIYVRLVIFHYFLFFLSLFFLERGGGDGRRSSQLIWYTRGGHPSTIKSHQPSPPPHSPKTNGPWYASYPKKVRGSPVSFYWMWKSPRCIPFYNICAKKIISCKHRNNMTSLWKHSSMKRSPITAPKEDDTCVTSAAEETVQFDDDTLRGEKNALCFLIYRFSQG